MKRRNIAYWPIATLRCEAEFGRDRGIADVDEWTLGGGRSFKPSSLESRARIPATVSRD